ncbi:hypothetical protein [Methanobrevibacter sp.]|uniref:hypothetical protein n=1 Tax=Methanobrevibacter sp. TaxID=66852 RepID=UPI00388E3AA5
MNKLLEASCRMLIIMSILISCESYCPNDFESSISKNGQSNHHGIHASIKIISSKYH